ncbi:cache domain-containing protein [Candidatus Margulisiibacteriota bacterium]
MKLKTRIWLTTTLIIFLSFIIYLGVTVFDLVRFGREDIEEVRIYELQYTKTNLKNFVGLAYEIIKTNEENARDKVYLEKYYGKQLKSIIEIAEAIIEDKIKLAARGKLSIAAAKKQAIREIRKIRYGDSGYIWINDTTLPYPRMIMHPISPELKGKILKNKKYNVALGKKQNLFQAFVEVCLKHGEGFVDYIWAKPTKKGLIPDVPKLTYVKLIKKWQWVIGTGIYVDDAIADAKEKTKHDIAKMRYDGGVGYFWINDTTLPYPKMIMHPISPHLDGKILDNPEYNCALGKDQNLFQAFVEVCNERGEGFVGYLWGKPTKDGELIPRQPKLSYVKVFRKWNWIIGTGVYLDNIDKAIALKQNEIKAQVKSLIQNTILITLLVLVLSILIIALLANSLTNPFKKLIDAMRRVEDSGFTDVSVKLNSMAEINELGDIFNSMVSAVNEAAGRLRESVKANNKIEEELSIAKDIQLNLLPKAFPKLPGIFSVDVYGMLKSAKAVGGDLYNYFFVDRNTLCVAIGDVSGKSVSASLFMAVTQTVLRAKAAKGLSSKEIIKSVNKCLYADNEASMFVTFFLGLLNINTGELDFCNAGHNPSYIIRKGNKLKALDTVHGMPLGLYDLDYDSGKITLEDNDKLVLYTDGVTEAHNAKNELFEEERLEKILTSAGDNTAEEITQKIYEKVAAFAEGVEQADDITILTVNYIGKK